MSESGFHKCACKSCQQRIEFPEEAAGSVIACPHCGADMTLEIPRPAPTAPATTAPATAAPARTTPPPAKSAPPAKATPTVKPAKAEPVLTTPEPVASPWDDPALEEKVRCQTCGAKARKTDKTCPNCGAAMKRSKLLVAFRVTGGAIILGLLVALPFVLPKKDKGGAGGKGGPDLTIYPHTMRKEQGVNLTYVVGNIANNSDNRYVGLKVEFELLGTNDVSVGSTSDYLPVLEPHRTWTYKAMVIDPDAIKATMTNWTAARHIESPKVIEERKAAEKKKKEDDAKAKKDEKKK
jgi:predicted RNA-binding Zn-ribbon protein involved in translation (DUF1610 family)